MDDDSRAPIELWGGVECTVNRVGDRYLSQLARNGHLTRPSDIDRFAALGLRALRVPLLWEVCQPEPSGPIDFSAFDPMLQRVRAHGMRAIAGLVHHGSGPAHTHLLDPQFEHGLAAYALRVAETYPWIDDFTPVNEPLTTARFSALYGHWYPHAADTASFMRALVHQCRATIRAMQAIRTIRPGARLVQTEDIANVRSTPLLAYQAEYENHRRFLSFDLLCGRVDRTHYMYGHLVHNGIGDDELAWFRANACPPDLLGLNYYFTSERYLDESLAAHPAWSHGGNGRHAYADVDAGLVKGLAFLGHRHVLETVWERYGLPVALSEVHAGCTREEQLRWLEEAWRGAHEARQAGADVRAVTVWSLLGSFDWNSLVRVEAGFYEPGVYDLRGAGLRPTAIATMVKSLAQSGSYDHPVLAGGGWWRRECSGERPSGANRGRVRPLLITGGDGGLAKAFAADCEVRGLSYVKLSRAQLDVSNHRQVGAAISEFTPWAVVNAAGIAPHPAAEQRAVRDGRANPDGPMVLADACSRHGIQLVTFSSDQVFDGALQRPYVEADPIGPRSPYGRCQAEAERYVLAACSDALIVRTSALFGAKGMASGLLGGPMRDLSRGQPVRLARDAIISPTYVGDLVTSCLDLLIDSASGLWHLANLGAVSPPTFLRQVAALAGLQPGLVEDEAGVAQPEFPPRNSVLGSQRGQRMPALEDALARWWRASATSFMTGRAA